MSEDDVYSETSERRIEREKMMRFGKALSILCEIHTATDHEVGFVVHSSARPDMWNLRSDGEYVEAWKAVRYAIGLQVDPNDGGMQ